MADYYAGTSVLVKRYVVERGSEWVRAVCDPVNGHVLITSELVAVEFISALMRRAREGVLAPELYRAQRDDFLTQYGAQDQIVPLTARVLTQARDLLERHWLRAYDALHLASALSANALMRAANLPALTLLAADERLLVAAQA